MQNMFFSRQQKKLKASDLVSVYFKINILLNNFGNWKFSKILFKKKLWTLKIIKNPQHDTLHKNFTNFNQTFL